MMSREELRQLAEFECRAANEMAVTFYFQPPTPKDKSHREEAIQAKEIVRRTLQELERNGRNPEVIQDLEKILHLVERLHGSRKAIFACAGRSFWREYDLPASVSETRLLVNRRFHLKPLAPLFSQHPRLCIALIDRQNARFLELYFERLRDLGGLTHPVPHHKNSDGHGGYDGSHAERHSGDEVRKHYQSVVDFLKTAAVRRQFDALVIGCHEVNWPDFERQLHPDLEKKILGRFSAEFLNMSNERVAEEANRIRRESLTAHHQGMLREAIEEARANGRAVTGLRRVLRATELGEVETILMSQEYAARAVECTNCRHIDSHLVPYCPVCGRATRKLEDVCEALVPVALRNNIALILLARDETLDRVGNIAAWLRFRADQNINQLRAAS